MATHIPIPGRLHSVNKEQIVTGANEVFDDKRGKNQQTINDELFKTQVIAETAASQSEYYNKLTTQAILSLNENQREVLEVTQAVRKHGDALEKIANQLGSTYVNDSTQEGDSYQGGLTFKMVTEAEMDILLSTNATEDNVVYLVAEND